MSINTQKTSINLFRKIVFYQLIITLLAGFLVPAINVNAAVPLVISNITITKTDKIATITWQTNRPAYGRIYYGLYPNNYHLTVNTNQKKTEQVMTISGLFPETDYFFRIMADDETSEVTSFEQSFETNEAGDNASPTIFDVQVAYTTGDTATIQWITNEKATSEIDYGMTESYGLSKRVGSRVKVHDITITGLTDGTYYHFRVKSKDKDNNTSRWYDMTFRTKLTDKSDRDDLVIYSVTPASENDINVTKTTAVISWRTNKLSQGWIRYGTSPSLGKTIATNPPRYFVHNITLINLDLGTTYYFEVEAKDVLGKRTKSQVYSFTTKTDGTVQPQNPVTNQGQILGTSYSEADPTFYVNYQSGFAPDIAQGSSEINESGSVSLVSNGSNQAASISSTSYLEYSGPGNFNINQGTVAFWFKPGWNSADGENHVLFDLNPPYNDANKKYFLIGKMSVDKQGVNNELAFGLEDSRDNDYWAYIDNVSIFANKWYFVAATWKYEGGSYKLYLNGTSDNLSYNKNSTLRHAPNLGDNIYIGSNKIPGDRFYSNNNNLENSLMDEVMIFDRVLDSDEIYQLYLDGLRVFSDSDIYGFSNSPQNNGVVLGASTEDNFDTTPTNTTIYPCNPDLGYTKITALYKTTDSPDIWALLETGQKHYITSPEAFNKYECDWSKIRVVSRTFLNSFANANLVRTPTDPKIHYLFQRPERKWLKRNIPSPTVFVSYPTNYWGNVARVDILDIASYPVAQLIKTTASPNVYLIEGTFKRHIKNVEVFERFGYDWAEVVELSQIHLDSFEDGMIID